MITIPKSNQIPPARSHEPLSCRFVDYLFVIRLLVWSRLSNFRAQFQLVEDGLLFVYKVGFEMARIRELAERYSSLNQPLLAINDRVVDLLPVARKRYYHPSQQGSWSIKKVLPAVVPELRYDMLDGVQDGGMAMNAFLEGIHSDTAPERKTQIEQQLLAYCKLDTPWCACGKCFPGALI